MRDDDKIKDKENWGTVLPIFELMDLLSVPTGDTRQLPGIDGEPATIRIGGQEVPNPVSTGWALPETRLARDERDFQLIVEREFAKSKIIRIEYFAKTWLPGKINEIITRLEDRYNDTYGEILCVCEEFLKWLKGKVSPSEPGETKLKIDEIALLYVYESRSITIEDASAIVREYGHKSGRKLYQRYLYYSKTSNRKGQPNPLTRTTLENKIALFERVKALLPIENQFRVKDEISILETYRSQII